VLGATSTGFIIGGLIIGKKGLGKNPLRTLLLINVVIGILGAIFTIRELWWLYAVGIFLFMCAIPAVEAAEQTVIQRVVPFERQGRVFGFAQSVEAAASPITAFMIGPIAQFWLIPYMNGDEGKAQFGWLLGQGEARGMALVFVATGIIAIVTALLVFRARAYRVLSDSYAKS
jgi:DHA3 family multidrug efflux protein-like MFS transporter